jgi:hypothetical protein
MRAADADEGGAEIDVSLAKADQLALRIPV